MNGHMRSGEGNDLYLASFALEVGSEYDVNLHGDTGALKSDLCPGRSNLSRPKVYYAIKRRLSPDTPLIVATITGAPKFGGMAAGLLTWSRDRHSHC